MLFNAKATLNESMDYIISTYELQQQLLLVCLSAISILNQETESPIKKKSFHWGIIFSADYSFNQTSELQQSWEKQGIYEEKKRKDTLLIACPAELYCSFRTESCCSWSQCKCLPRKGEPLKQGPYQQIISIRIQVQYQKSKWKGTTLHIDKCNTKNLQGLRPANIEVGKITKIGGQSTYRRHHCRTQSVPSNWYHFLMCVSVCMYLWTHTHFIIFQHTLWVSR